ncbi:hypothetical protein K6V92_10340 [Cupriavidus respiraculi]|uniref:hypothetical protein n=1 Tax=Cupriavidus respiraculi TaxID=195930 RepID=UPI001C9848E6|nr:hypothetical protein [Cupriavidus respiraculi]MBY4947016.1 hypothetical protein [Cupriavidus respiraculi]
MGLQQALQDKLDWLRATQGVTHAQVKLSADELEAVCMAERAVAFCRRLLDPEGYGFAVTAEVRDAAREAVGLPKVETVRRRDG